MKLILLSLLLLLLPGLLLAQNAPRPLAPVPPMQPPGMPVSPGYSAVPTTLPDNYQITLILTEKDKEKDGDPLEISLVVASRTFTAVLADSGVNFGGDLTLEESGSILVNYNLGWETPVPPKSNQPPQIVGSQYMSSRTTGSVRLKVGEELQIIRAGTRTATLSIQKLPLAKAK
ncbi:hypothetical protein [Prosthecobacter sp.]|uniref:hypothetical protein n=1 Tax=Prosthecobacter sp. TaxID=1965333 RepID=UPI003784CC9A